MLVLRPHFTFARTPYVVPLAYSYLFLHRHCHVSRFRRAPRSERFSSRVPFYGGKYIWCARGSWNYPRKFFATFQGLTKISLRQDVCRSPSHEGLGPYPGPGLTSSLTNRFDCIVRGSRGGTFARFVNSSIGGRRGAARTRGAMLLLVLKVEQLPR